MSQIIYGIEDGVFIVDKEDYHWLNQYEWRDHPHGYAQAIVNGRLISMHRLIMKDPEGYMVDHKNRLVNDNRKKNLRLSTPSLNQANKRKSENKSSKYKGVTTRKSGYETVICKDGEYIYLGIFESEESAANCYNYHAQRLFGEHARLNDVIFKNKEVWERDKSEKKILSDYLGVHRHKKENWRVRFSVHGRETVFGYYTDEQAAANVYNHYAKKYKAGRHLILNDVSFMSIDKCEEYELKNEKTSMYKGVAVRPSGKWLARVYHSKKSHEIGLYKSEEEAAIAYNRYVLEMGLDRPLNILDGNSSNLRVLFLIDSHCKTSSLVRVFLKDLNIEYEKVKVRDGNVRVGRGSICSFPTVIMVDDNENIIYKTSGFKPTHLKEIGRLITEQQ